MDQKNEPTQSYINDHAFQIEEYKQLQRLKNMPLIQNNLRVVNQENLSRFQPNYQQLPNSSPIQLLKRQKSPRLAQNQNQELNQICPHCFISFKVSIFQQHLVDCDQQLIRCQYCDQEYPIFLLDDHYEQCSCKKDTQELINNMQEQNPQGFSQNPQQLIKKIKPNKFDVRTKHQIPLPSNQGLFNDRQNQSQNGTQQQQIQQQSQQQFQQYVPRQQFEPYENDNSYDGQNQRPVGPTNGFNQNQQNPSQQPIQVQNNKYQQNQQNNQANQQNPQGDLSFLRQEIQNVKNNKFFDQPQRFQPNQDYIPPSSNQGLNNDKQFQYPNEPQFQQQFQPEFPRQQFEPQENNDSYDEKPVGRTIFGFNQNYQIPPYQPIQIQPNKFQQIQGNYQAKQQFQQEFPKEQFELQDNDNSYDGQNQRPVRPAYGYNQNQQVPPYQPIQIQPFRQPIQIQQIQQNNQANRQQPHPQEIVGQNDLNRINSNTRNQNYNNARQYLPLKVQSNRMVAQMQHKPPSEESGRIPVYSFSNNRNLSPSAKCCIICEVNYEEGSQIKILGCAHRFHSNCLNEWLLHKKICPICQRDAFEGLMD